MAVKKSKSEASPAPKKAEPKPETKVEAKPEPKAELKPEPKATPKSAAKSSPKAAPAVAADTAAKTATPKAAPTKAAPKAEAKKPAPVKLTDKQAEFLKTIHSAGNGGYKGDKKAEAKAIEALLGKKLIKKGAKDKTSGAYHYTVSKAGEKHLSTSAPAPAS